MQINDVNSGDLNKMLSTCGVGAKHGYLGQKIDGKNHYIHAFSSKEKLEKAKYKHLKCTEIRDIANTVLTNEKDLTIPENVANIKNVVSNINKLGADRNSKMNTSTRKVARFFLFVLTVCSFISIVGIPLGIFLSSKLSSLNKLQKENLTLKSFSNPLRPPLVENQLNELIKNVQGKDETVQIKELSDSFNDYLSDKLDDNEYTQYKKMVSRDSDVVPGKLFENGILTQFKKDHTRITCDFKIIDKSKPKATELQIDSMVGDVDPNDHFVKVLKNYSEFIIDNELHEFDTLIQSIVSQGSMQTLYAFPKVHFLSEFAGQSFEGPSGGDYKFDLQIETPKLTIEIIKNTDGNSILKVDSKVRLNVLASKEQEEGSKTESPQQKTNEINCKLSYEVKLPSNKNSTFTIDNLQTKYNLFETRDL